MAFDGIVVSCLAHELQETIVNGRILKISQPEPDEIILTIKNYDQYKVLLSASAGLPLVYLTESSPLSPMTAPNFCMLLRKHLSSARIISVTQPGLERILRFEIEHLDEMGDVRKKYLILELMGKHSNLIFCDDENRIIDSIKRVSGFVSSVREVLPGRDYFIPQTSEKLDPFTADLVSFQQLVLQKPMPLSKAIYSGLTGFSPLMANELCQRASLDSQQPANTLQEDEGIHLHRNLERMMEAVSNHEYMPVIYYNGKEPVEFSAMSLQCYEDLEAKEYSSVSAMLEAYYAEKNQLTRIRQKSADLRKIVGTAIERVAKKYDLQSKQLKDTQKREKYQVYGELLMTYGYEAKPGDKEITVQNYYTNEPLTIPLDPTISALDNAKKYFEKYSKQKRTFEALTKYIEETKEEMEHLDSIRTALDIAEKEEDLVEVKEELTEFGYIRRHYDRKVPQGKNGKKQKKVKITSQPFHYISSDGFSMYVGKNNFQNDALTFEFANGDDWWFHAKGIPGSHVIVKSKGQELPDRTFEEAASLAAFYSKSRDAEKVEIDYVEKKHVKKPGGGKPGFVVYYTNYSMLAKTDISHITLAGGSKG